MRQRKTRFYETYGKRLWDILLSSMLLVLFSWLFLLLGVLVRTRLGSPVLFRQSRVGKDGKLFDMIKFRTMTDERDETGSLLPDECRLTKFGRWLRSSSLDELPEIWLIFIGHMSVVGPRPLMPEYLPYYTASELHRHDAKPGLTGLAQVKGRSFLSWEQVFSYDLEYISHISFLGDVKIFFATIGKVLMRQNIADVTQASLGQDGHFHYKDAGQDIVLHQPLNIEREGKRQHVQGNRE